VSTANDGDGRPRNLERTPVGCAINANRQATDYAQAGASKIGSKHPRELATEGRAAAATDNCNVERADESRGPASHKKRDRCVRDGGQCFGIVRIANTDDAKAQPLNCRELRGDFGFARNLDAVVGAQARRRFDSCAAALPGLGDNSSDGAATNATTQQQSQQCA
jgi:hypothetical protein